MEPFKTHKGIIATLDRANVDTDQIIPKQFLKSIKKTGFGENLFFDRRYLPDGKPNPDFELNQSWFKGATILVTRNNFGCGSSREHAVWALVQYGFKVIIAPRSGDFPPFADIFRNNSVKNGLLLVELKESEVNKIFQTVSSTEKLEATVDLENQQVILHSSEKITFHFEIDKSIKEHLLRGMDEIGLTLEHEKKITRFEKNHSHQLFK